MIKELIKKMIDDNREVYSLIGTVTAIDLDKRLVDVQPINDTAEIVDVRLQSQLSIKKGLVVYPKVGSFVVVTFINEVTAYVAMCSEVSEVKLCIDGQEVTIDNKGISAKSDTADLADTVKDLLNMMNDLLTNLTTFKVICSAPGSPSGSVFPDNIAKLQSSKGKLTVIERQFNSLLKKG